MNEETTDSEPQVLIEAQGDIAWLWMNRPEAHNALAPALVQAMYEGIHALAVERPRALVIAGKGPSFCSGADIKWLRESGSRSEEENREDALFMGHMMGKIAAFPAPVIARVHGTVAGGGNGIVAAADIAIADRDTTFVFSEVRLGIVPAVISPFVVHRIGAARAATLWMTAERFHGDAAERWGLVHRSVDGLELDGAIDQAIANIRAGAPGAQVEARRLAQRVNEMTAEDLATLNAQMRVTEEAVEGLQAFIERRKPGWAE